MNARDLGFGLGAALAVVGLLGAFTQAVDPSQLGGDQFRSLLGLAGVVAGLAFLRRLYRADSAQYEPDECERLAPLPSPGHEFDEQLALAGSRDEEVARYYGGQVREELRSVAVEVLATHRNVDRETAREQLRSGTWTDDPDAARFFVHGSDAAEDVRGAIAGRVRGVHPAARRARRAVAELRAIASSEVVD